MGYTKRGMCRHLADKVLVEANVPKRPLNTDPISSFLYEKCEPTIHAPALCGVSVFNFLHNFSNRKLIDYGYHWDDDFSCETCLRIASRG